MRAHGLAHRAQRSLRSLLRPRWLGLALGLLAVAPLACEGITCFANQCVGGLEWYAEADGDALLPGSYAFEATLDGTRVGFECTIADTLGASECTAPVVLEGDGDFETEVSLRAVQEGFQDPNDQVGSIVFHAYEPVADGVRGPDDVHIEGTRDGQPIVDETYALTYERDENYHGDERCGFCDLTQTRTFEITG